VKTLVVHCKREYFDIYIGRGIVNGKQLKWGNPFSHKDGTLAEFKVSSRKEAIEKFEEYLLKNEELMKSLHELKGKTLGCWCKPKSCHGDILAKWADGIGNEIF
jgi:hypothetical protein